jgi:hypothetical protein
MDFEKTQLKTTQKNKINRKGCNCCVIYVKKGG